MQLETTRFGAVEIDDGAVITLTQPIIGFQDQRRFVLLPGPADSTVKWLQSAELGNLAFLLMDPRHVMQDYKVDVSADELAELGVSSIDELDIFTLVVVPPDRSQVRTNLKAPILINLARRLGKQTILERSDYPIQFFLAQAKEGDPEHKEVENARTDT